MVKGREGGGEGTNRVFPSRMSRRSRATCHPSSHHIQLVPDSLRTQITLSLEPLAQPVTEDSPINQTAGQYPGILGLPGSDTFTSTYPPVKQNLFHPCKCPLV